MEAYNKSEFYQTFKNYNRSVGYCTLCLRSGDGRRLVKSKTLKEFAKAMRFGAQWRDSQMLCYICEGQAANALRFYKMARFAYKIKNIVNIVCNPNSKHSRLEVNTLKNKFNVFRSRIKKEKLGTLDSVDGELRSIRRMTQLTQTEVLFIDVQGKQARPAVAGPPAPEDVIQLNRPYDDNDSACEDIKDIIVLDGDDEDPLSTANKHTERVQPVPPHAKNAQQNQAPLLEAVLTFPKMAVPGDILRPTVTAASLDGKTQVKLPGIQFANFEVQGYVLRPIVMDRDGRLPVPLTTTSQTDSSNQRHCPNDNGVVNVHEPLMVVQENELVNGKVDAPVTAAVGKRKKGGDSGGGRSLVPWKAPLENNARIDWEDKIPMDVITYLDATDPNADMMLTPPHPSAAPSISQVRSLTNATTRRARRPSTESIIDLC